jgi:hypothetical protein
MTDTPVPAPYHEPIPAAPAPLAPQTEAAVDARYLQANAVKKQTGWLVYTLVACWPVALWLFLTRWQKIDQAVLAGDFTSARNYAATIRKSGIIILICWCGVTALWVGATVLLLIAAAAGSGG